MPSIENLTDDDAIQLVSNLNNIINLADKMARSLGDVRSDAHDIYRLARDSRDMMIFDQVSRDVVRNLTSSSLVIDGHKISDTVVEYLQARQFIQAIKQLRTESGLGLAEAKTVCESARTALNLNSWA